jgi:hypothetical protein
MRKKEGRACIHPQILAEKPRSLWKVGRACIRGDLVGVTGVGPQNQWTAWPYRWELENLIGGPLAVSMVLQVELTSKWHFLLTLRIGNLSGTNNEEATLCTLRLGFHLGYTLVLSYLLCCFFLEALQFLCPSYLVS